MTINTRYNQIQQELDFKKELIIKLGTQLETYKEQINIYDLKIQEQKDLENLYYQASQIYSQITRTRTQEIKIMLENVLNIALKYIPMDSIYEAEIIGPDYTKVNPRVEIRLVDTETGHHRTPLIGTGTMLAQLISFLMSVIVLKFSNARRIMILDEVLSGFYNEESIRVFGDILVALSEREGFQFITVEHKSELEKVEGAYIIEVEKNNYEDGLTIKEIKRGEVSVS